MLMLLHTTEVSGLCLKHKLCGQHTSVALIMRCAENLPQGLSGFQSNGIRWTCSCSKPPGVESPFDMRHQGRSEEYNVYLIWAVE